MRNAIILTIILAVTASFAQTYVSGAVSGVWDSTGSPFYVTDSICVPSGDSLRIGPGVEVIFQGHYKFCVDSAAVLKAIGTAEDSIIFTAEDTAIYHRGLRLFYVEPGCSISHCAISRGSSHWESCPQPDSMGGAVFWIGCNPTIIHNSFTCNQNTALYAVYDSSLNIDFNTFHLNTGHWGADINLFSCSGKIANNSFSDGNSISSILIYISKLLIVNCQINSSDNGIGVNPVRFLSIDTSKIIVLNCNLTNHVGSGIITNKGGQLSVINTTFSDNRYAIRLHGPISDSARAYVSNCLIDPEKCYLENSHTVLDFGDGNINADPLFVDTASGDFHLQDGSPCIDAGAESVYVAIWDTVIYAPTIDIDSSSRPQGLGWDIGAYESPYSATCEVEINRGWNLFSIPSTTSEPTSSFGTSVFGYDRAVADYYTPDSIVNGAGYWSLGLTSETVEVPGNLPSFTDTLYRGWNLIGAIRYPIPNSRIVTEPAGLGMSSPYGWDGTDYFLADSLYPGKGYWFLSSGNGRITVGP